MARRRKFVRRRRFRRRFRRRGIPLGISHRTRAILPYTNGISVIAGATTGTYQFRLNSLFDPDLTGIGQQPNWRDEYLGLYKYYRVYMATVEVLFESIAGVSIRAAICASAETSTSFNIGDLGGFPYSRLMVIQNAANSGTRKLRIKVPIWKLLGMSFRQYMSDNNALTTQGNNPTYPATLYIRGEVSDGLTNSDLRALVRVKYHTEFSVPVNPALS